jgi:hypothetical protein
VRTSFILDGIVHDFAHQLLKSMSSRNRNLTFAPFSFFPSTPPGSTGGILILCRLYLFTESKPATLALS